MQNKVSYAGGFTEYPVSKFEGGDLVVYASRVYVVVNYTDNLAGIRAVSLTNGGHIGAHTLVSKLLSGTEITIVAG